MNQNWIVNDEAGHSWEVLGREPELDSYEKAGHPEEVLESNPELVR